MATSKSKSSHKPATGGAKSGKTSTAKPASKPAAKSIESKVSSNVIKLIDQAAVVLRKSVETGAEASEKARSLAHRRAHSLIEDAHKRLTQILDDSETVLKKGVKKIAP